MSIAGAMQGKAACYYEGKAYSPGAVANMAGQVEMACTRTDGDLHWVRLRSTTTILLPAT